MGAAGAPGDAIDFTGGSSSLALGISPTTIGTLEGGLGVTGTLTLIPRRAPLSRTSSTTAQAARALSSMIAPAH